MSYKQALFDLREELFKAPEQPKAKTRSSGLIPVRMETESPLKEAKLPVYADWLKTIASMSAELRQSAQKAQEQSGGFAEGFASTVAQSKPSKQVEAVPEKNRESFISRREDLPSYYAPKNSKAGSFKDLIDIHEGAGDYDTLFQHSQKSGKAFENIRVSQMTIGEVKAFAGARGEGSYYSWSKANMPKNLEAYKKGLGSTPMGRYQFIGTTLKEVAEEMGLSDDTVFSPEVQDAMFDHYLHKRISRGKTVDDKIAQLRGAWEGFRNVDRGTLANLVVKYGET